VTATVNYSVIKSSSYGPHWIFCSVLCALSCWKYE